MRFEKAVIYLLKQILAELKWHYRNDKRPLDPNGQDELL